MNHTDKLRIVILFLLLLVFPFQSGNADETVFKSFQTKKEFIVLILADPQDTDKPQQAMLDLLNASLDASKPDLVIFLGDMIHGPSVKGYTSVKKAIDAIVQPIVQRNIPFALVFGNHDNQSGVSKDEQLEIYQSYSGCLAINGEEMPGCGNYFLLIENPVISESPIVLWFLDSGTYAEPGKGTYGYVTEEQNAWMLAKYAEISQSYASPASYVFQHIPIPQVYGMIQTVSFGTPSAVTCYGPNFGKWYVPNREMIREGNLGEGPCSSEYDSGEFEAWKTMHVRAAFFGHDHLNDYCGTYEGIDLIATSGLGFYLYGPGDKHGARMITFRAEKPLDYETKMLYYRDIVDSSLPGLFVPTLGVLIQQYVLLGFAGLLLVITVAAVLIRHRRKGKKKHASV